MHSTTNGIISGNSTHYNLWNSPASGCCNVQNPCGGSLGSCSHTCSNQNVHSSSHVTPGKDKVPQWNQSRDHNGENKCLDGQQMGDLDDNNDEIQSPCGRFWTLNWSSHFSSLNIQAGAATHPAWYCYLTWMDYRCKCFIHLPATSEVLVAAKLTISALSSDCL